MLPSPRLQGGAKRKPTPPTITYHIHALGGREESAQTISGARPQRGDRAGERGSAANKKPTH